MTQVVFDVSAFINSRHVGAVQYGITILCGLMMFLDGFDTQAISYMAPLIAKEWGLSREVLGPIFSSALTGLMVGYLLLSPLSDRFGHRMRSGCRTQAGVLPRPRSEALPTFACRAYSSGLPAISAFTTCTM